MPIDVLNGKAFNLASMTQAINRAPRTPRRIIDGLKLFREIPVRTRTIQIEERNGILQLIPAGTIKDPGTPARKGRRTLRSIDAPQLKLDDQIAVEDLVDLRAFGEGDAQEAVADEINRYLGEQKDSHGATWEHMAIGAIKGKVMDHDGTTVLYDIADFFGVNQPTAVDFDLDTAASDVVGKITSVKRTIESAMGNTMFDGFHALCSASFWDAFIKHDAVKSAFELYNSGQFFRDDQRKGFLFQGVLWEEYNHTVGTVDFITDGDAHIFPIGTGIFERYNAPANYLETVRTAGLPVYAKQWPNEDDSAVKIQSVSNPIFMSRYPKALQRIYT